MPQTPCPKCNHQVSEWAPYCPHCGQRIVGSVKRALNEAVVTFWRVGFGTVCLFTGLIAVGYLIDIAGPGIGGAPAVLVLWFLFLVWKNAVKKFFPSLSEVASKKQLKLQGDDNRRGGVVKELAKEAALDGAKDVAMDAVKEGVKGLLR